MLDLLAMTNSLYSKAITILQCQRGSWAAIARESGISYSWIAKFANGKITNPGIKRIEDLMAHLTRQGVIGHQPKLPREKEKR